MADPSAAGYWRYRDTPTDKAAAKHLLDEALRKRQLQEQRIDNARKRSATLLTGALAILTLLAGLAEPDDIIIELFWISAGFGLLFSMAAFIVQYGHPQYQPGLKIHKLTDDVFVNDNPLDDYNETQTLFWMARAHETQYLKNRDGVAKIVISALNFQIAFTAISLLTLAIGAAA